MPTKTPLPALPASPGPERVEADVELVEVVTADDKRREDMRAAVELGAGLFTVLVRGLRRPRPPQ